MLPVLMSVANIWCDPAGCVLKISEDDHCVCPGSDVNSMDSVDSGYTVGAGETQSNHTASSSSELIIWEIEVPKVS